MPAFSYSLMMSCALSMDAFVSNDKRASTSVDTRPGMILRISVPNATSRLSMICGIGFFACSLTVFSSSGL